MIRHRALQGLMVLVGLLYSAAIYPIFMALRHPGANDDTGDTMMMSLYFTLGVFLLIAARNPAAHRSLIAFTAWSNFAHAIVMSTLGFSHPDEKSGFLVASAILVAVGVALLALSARSQSIERAAPSGA